ncbi:MAG: hypothetical protein JSU96_07160 [Acidobacteriota bacterium]|nr:MAG: hypothetical protein JSU96_07160 [Acidobacteriota bacterium]
MCNAGKWPKWVRSSYQTEVMNSKWRRRCVSSCLLLLVTTVLIPVFSFAQTLSVQLEWDSNPLEDQVAGYNLYRSNQSGSSYVRLNVTLIPNTTYTDTTIEAGRTYYYVCTAVNTSDLESGFSNEVPYTVPGGTICPGEVNDDTTRNVLDVILIMNHIVGNLTLTGDNQSAADVNLDGSVNVLDTVLLQNHVVGNVTLSPCL